MENTEQI